MSRVSFVFFSSLLLLASTALICSVASAQFFPFPLPGFGFGDSSAPAARSVQKLPPLSGDAKAVSVSGISAGAYMATQLQVAFSGSIMGVGSIAGGPWNCSEGSLFNAETTCMATTSQVDPDGLVAELRAAAKKRRVDPLENLKMAHVYLYNSPVDQTVRAPINEKTKAFYSNLVPEEHIKTETSIESAHGFPTLNYGVSCGTMDSPYMNNCGFDGAGEIFKQIYSDASMTLNSVKAVESSLHAFNQSEFAKSQAMLAKTGWVYIPEKCRLVGASCAVHVALHGCLQASENVQDAFALHAGYNEWAEGSGIIVLYPQAESGFGNPNACFDWWGFTGPEYANKKGPQMKAIKAMIDRVLGS